MVDMCCHFDYKFKHKNIYNILFNIVYSDFFEWFIDDWLENKLHKVKRWLKLKSLKIKVHGFKDLNFQSSSNVKTWK